MCSQSIATILEKMFRGEHTDLLQDLLERMQSAGVRIPHELLPAALNMQAKQIQAALYPVLGERGLWLSQFNSAWSWVRNKKSSGLTTTDMRQTLITLLPAQDAERKVQQLFVNSGLSGNADWAEQLEELPKPWSTEFGERYLLELRHYIETLKPGTRSYPYNDSWYQSISIAARALPPSCFAAALKPWTLPDNQNWQIAQWQQELDSCMETLRLRQRLIEEVTKK